MPLQNRVDPSGSIFASPARGTIMGNRGGAIHNEQRVIVRQFKGTRWITCLLEFKGRKRSVMSPGLYTELFFLDEAVAFAAGHRPCAECRRDRFNAFRAAWQRRGDKPNAVYRAFELDAELHPTRVDREGRKVTFQEELNLLPNGCFVQMEREQLLVLDDALLVWTPDGYSRRVRRPSSITVTVLTPRPVVECFRQGYQPAIHSSA